MTSIDIFFLILNTWFEKNTVIGTGNDTDK